MTVDAPKHRHNTLVLSAGRRVELVRQFGAASARLLPGSRVVAADAVPERSASCQIAEVSARLPRVADTDYRAELTALCEDQAIGLIVPTIDTELSTLARMRSIMAGPLPPRRISRH